MTLAATTAAVPPYPLRRADVRRALHTASQLDERLSRRFTSPYPGPGTLIVQLPEGVRARASPGRQLPRCAAASMVTSAAWSSVSR